MAVAGEIAASAHGELPESWRALQNDLNYGDSFLQRKINSIMTQVFGEVLTADEQDDLDLRIVDYTGKLVALELINPARDYWAKQVTYTSAGERESKSWTDRSQALKELREDLLKQTRSMYAEITGLIPNRRRPSNEVPVVRDIQIAHTPNPFDFEPAYLSIEEIQ